MIRIAKSGAKAAPTLPGDAVTRTFGIFGMKDSGKTNTGRVVVEGVCKVGGHAVVLDPVGVWWGATRAGEGAGIPGVVIGGEHGDVPLEETGGKLIAEVALERQYPLIVVDMKLLRKGAQRRFLADFLEELYYRNRLPLSVVFEEADQALPQNPRGMDPTLGRVLGAAEDIVKLGRSRGLGAILISQRLATVNKNVTEQIENLMLLRLVGPNDLKAVKEWVQSNGDPVATAKVLDTIASLYQGEAWMYSPGWLRLLERLKMRHARTLDTSATPTNEQVAIEEGAKRAPVSLDELRVAMAETVERALANDPGELRKRVVELERELAGVRAAGTETVREVVWPFTEDELEVVLGHARQVVTEAAEAATVLARVEQNAQHARDCVTVVEALTERLLPMVDMWRLRKDAEAVSLDKLVGVVPGNSIAPARAAPVSGSASKSPDVSRDSAADDGELSAGAQRLLADMERLYPMRVTRGQLAALLKRGAKSSTLTQQLSELVNAGAIESDHGYVVRLGNAAQRDLSPEQQVDLWRRALPDGPRAMFEVMLGSGVPEVERAELFSLAGFSLTSSTPVEHLKLLADNGLVERHGSTVRLLLRR